MKYLKEYSYTIWLGGTVGWVANGDWRQFGLYVLVILIPTISLVAWGYKSRD